MLNIICCQETQIKTRMRGHFTPTRLAVVESQQLLGSARRNQSSHTVLLETKRPRRLGEQSGSSHRWRTATAGRSSAASRYILRTTENICPRQNLRERSQQLYSQQTKKRKQPKWPSTGSRVNKSEVLYNGISLTFRKGMKS